MFATKVILACLLAVVVLAEEKPTVEVLTEQSFVREDGYNFEYKTSDGTSRKEEANLITVGEHQGIGIKGSYSYTAPDGQVYEVTFTADENGYKPQIRVVPPQ